jgi:NADH-quinone oxidoreductase subunit E
VSHLRPELRQRAEEIVALYPHARSATVPLCHLAQEQDGYLTEPAMAEIAELTATTPAEVRGTASFYDLLHLEPVGTYVVGVCTNIACLLAGGMELLAHASETLGVPVGGTTPDATFTLEECECLGDCDVAPCVQVNSRFVRTTTPDALDALVAQLRDGARASEIPEFGTLSRVRRAVGLVVPSDEVTTERTKVRLAAAPPSEPSR